MFYIVCPTWVWLTAFSSFFPQKVCFCHPNFANLLGALTLVCNMMLAWPGSEGEPWTISFFLFWPKNGKNWPKINGIKLRRFQPVEKSSFSNRFKRVVKARRMNCEFLTFKTALKFTHRRASNSFLPWKLSQPLATFPDTRDSIKIYEISTF